MGKSEGSGGDLISESRDRSTWASRRLGTSFGGSYRAILRRYEANSHVFVVPGPRRALTSTGSLRNGNQAQPPNSPFPLQLSTSQSSVQLGHQRTSLSTASLISNNLRASHCSLPDASSVMTLDTESIGKVHKALFPSYGPTPLVSLPKLAKELGCKELYVKDETQRYGLPAFKVLGASWGLCRLLGGRYGVDPWDIAAVKEKVRAEPSLGVYTATDGELPLF